MEEKIPEIVKVNENNSSTILMLGVISEKLSRIADLLVSLDENSKQTIKGLKIVIRTLKMANANIKGDN